MTTPPIKSVTAKPPAPPKEPTPPPLKWMRLHPKAFAPTRAYPSDVGLDLRACLISESGRENTLLVPAQNTRRVPTCIAIEPPTGYFAAVCSRSGMATKNPPLFVANAPGIIDPGYRGALDVILFNGGFSSVYITHGQCIGQLVLFPVWSADHEEVMELSTADRGHAGFGSTGE